MSTLNAIVVWVMLAAVAVMTRQSAWDYAAGLCTIVAMLPLAWASRAGLPKRVAIRLEAQAVTPGVGSKSN